jgi:hypothetical protein
MSNTKQPYPNQSPAPSQVHNTPQVSPLMGLGGSDHLIEPSPGNLDLSTVDEMAGMRVSGIGDIPMQGPTNDLAILRALFPFLPILPLQAHVAAVWLPTAGTPDELTFPDGTTLALFGLQATAIASVLASVNGNAEILSAVNTPAKKTGTASTVFSFVIPQTGMLFYVGNIKSLSVVSNVAGVGVTALCYQTNHWNKGRR